MNLPNAITVARILASPLIAYLPFAPGPGARFTAFLLYVAAAVTDYWDGHLARTRNLVTDLGRLLDPLADKLLLVATLVPMYALMHAPWLVRAAGAGTGGAPRLPFVTPVGWVALPWWVLAVVLGRELFMTLFRQFAARRGIVIAAIGPAKWKTGFQLVWVGAAYFWFFASALAIRQGWGQAPLWRTFAQFNGTVGAVTMAVAVALTIYSLALYLVRYGAVVVRGRPGPTA